MMRGLNIRVLVFGFWLIETVLVAQEDSRLVRHATPRPLSEGAVCAHWPRFLGPRDDATTPEQPLEKDWAEGGPSLLWELARGEGYASPAIAGERLVLFHRDKGHERIECRHAVTGEAVWEHAYPVDYRDRYGYQNGPRGSPVIDGDRVYTLGVTSHLTCLDLATGDAFWEVDLGAGRTPIRPSFFGAGTSPLVYGDQLIVMLGAEGACVASFDKHTGELLWDAESEWGASYASPQAMGDKVLVFCGGESRPPHGGLVALDPARKGKILGRFPWRGEKYESVNASTPVVLRGQRVFITQCYGGGGVLLQLGEGGFAELWRGGNYGAHWMNPVTDAAGETLFLVDGRHQQNARLVAVDIASGEELWEEVITWQASMDGRPYNLGIQRAGLIRADGGFLCLGELGSLLWLRLDREGAEVQARCQPFLAPQSWTLPALSRGLLYLMQNEEDHLSAAGPRLLCYDLRGRGEGLTKPGPPR